MGAIIVAILVAVFVFLLMTSNRIRDAGREFFDYYCMKFFRSAWRYFLIYVLYALIENRDISPLFDDWFYFVQIAVGAAGVYLIIMVISNRFRVAAAAIWEHYVLVALQLGWPYAAIVAPYQVCSDGSAAGLVRRLVSGAV